MKSGNKARHKPSHSANATTGAGSSAAVRAFDVETLLDRCLGDGEFCRRLLLRFADRSAELLAALDFAAGSQIAAELARQAHALQGLAANLSAESLRFWAATLERATLSGSPEHARPFVGKVRAEIERCVRAVPQLVEQLAERK